MSKSDAQYRRELELELERLTKELTDVRIQKSKQRLRIEQLQQEQNLLKDQLEDSSNSNDKELRTGLAHQITTLTQVVKQKKVEHHMVKQEWEKSQEEYHQLKRTVGLLQGANVVIAHQNLVMQNEDDASLDEDLTSMPPAASTQSKDFLHSMWGSMKSNPNQPQQQQQQQQSSSSQQQQGIQQSGHSFRTAFAEGLANEAAIQQTNHNSNNNYNNNYFNVNFESGYQTSFSKDFETMPEAGTTPASSTDRGDAFHFHEDEEAEAEAALEDDYDANDDGGTVITEHTKDSLQVYRKSKDESRRPRKSRETNGTGGGLGTYFENDRKKGSSYTTKMKGPDTTDRGAIE